MKNEKQYRNFVAHGFKVFPSEIETMLHAAVGISGEAGELLEVVKKAWVYDGADPWELDWDRLERELGDVFFYVTALTTLMGLDYGTLAEMNMEKLRKRYPDRRSANRDGAGQGGGDEADAV